MRLKITFPTLTPMHDGSHVFCVSALSYPEECQLKLEAMCLPSLHALCSYKFYLMKCKALKQMQNVSLDTTQKGL